MTATTSTIHLVLRHLLATPAGGPPDRRHPAPGRRGAIARALATALTAACATADLPLDGALDASDLSSLAITAPRGELTVFAADPALDPGAPEVAWSGRLVARGASGAGARDRLAEATFDAWSQDGRAALVADLPRRVALELTVTAPAAPPLEARAPRGRVVAHGLTGGVVVEGSRVELWDVAGPVTAEVGGGSGLMRVRPARGAGVRVRIDQGDLWLQLPIGLPYHLLIEGSPDGAWEVGALGLAEVVDVPGRFEGRAGDGSVPIRVASWGGSVLIDGY
jgi:hypothetical protein